MIQVTYLDHSGFAVTTEKAILVFDYYKDPANALHKILDANRELPVLFFVSHHHSDHYAPQIYNLAQNHKRVYILSNDVDGDRIPSKDKLSVANVSAGDVLDNLPGDVRVKAFGSTDAGVSFAVTLADGKTIFHAGDFNDWHWKDESTQAEIDKAERHFVTILNRIAEDEHEFYVAMFPVDERQGTDFSRGATLFTDKIKVRNFFPMHFGADFKGACDFGAYIKDKDTRCFCLKSPGHSVELDG